MPAVGGVYTIINVANGHQYIGSSMDLRRREHTHWRELEQGRHHCEHLQRAFVLYGRQMFEFRILEYVPGDRAQLLPAEQRWIDTRRPIYNSLPIAGSHLGRRRSPESIERMRQAQNDPAVRAKKSAALKGRVRPPEVLAKMAQANTGKRHTQETKDKLSHYFTGRKVLHPGVRHTTPRTPETIERHREGLIRCWEYRDHTVAPEVREKIAATLRGRVLSDEHRRKVSEGVRRAWERRKQQRKDAA